MERPARIAEQPPLPHRLARGLGGERTWCRPASEPFKVRGDDAGNRRLLQHDLADEHGPRRRGRLAPGQIACVPPVPVQDGVEVAVSHDRTDPRTPASWLACVLARPGPGPPAPSVPGPRCPGRPAPGLPALPVPGPPALPVPAPPAPSARHSPPQHLI